MSQKVLNALDHNAYKILKTLTDKGNLFYVDLMNESGIARSSLNRKINQLLELGLIEVEYVKDPKVRRPRALYKITEKGVKILRLLDDILNTLNA